MRYACEEDCKSALGKRLMHWRADRPSEWLMDEFIQQAETQAAELEAAKARNQRLTTLLQDIVDADETPDANCSCHISPPCGDCVTYGHMRDLMTLARKLAKGE